MRIGFIGLGKLGLPMALAINSSGHEVWGYDVDGWVSVYLDTEGRGLPYEEQGIQGLLGGHSIQWRTPDEIADWADLIFIAVQTPHAKQFEGVTRLPEDRFDFNYDYLCEALTSVDHARGQVVVISTVLPGTLASLGATHVLYNPSFIAMGTTIPDFLDPEFVLIGTDGAATSRLRDFYASIHVRPIFVTTIKTAELTKVAYNTYLGMKIVFANAMMEICEKIGADVDDLVDALSLADRRIISSAYMRGGMGDGGGCHPRDNIALSWLARELDLSHDIFEDIMLAREDQTEWLAELAMQTGQPIELLGKSYKPGTNLTTGSPARLLASLLEEREAVFSHTDIHD